jgi:thioredoxin 2
MTPHYRDSAAGEVAIMERGNVIIACTKCRAKNRVPRARLDDHPICGKCRSPLSLNAQFPAHSVPIRAQAFQQEVLGFPGPVAAMFWTPRCTHCHTFTPVFEQVAREFAGKAKFVTMNIDESPAMMSQYDIQGSPTVLFFRNSRVVGRIPGAVPKEHLAYQLTGMLHGA